MFRLNNPIKTEDLSGYYVESNVCPDCNGVQTVKIDSSKMYAYHQGAYAQDVLYGFDVATRERFITGYCGDCWSKMFSNEEEN